MMFSNPKTAVLFIVLVQHCPTLHGLGMELTHYDSKNVMANVL